MFRILFVYLLVACFSSGIASADKEDCTELARDEETLLVFSTLGGGLTAIDPITSDLRWTINDEEPVIKAAPKEDTPLPHYLPDPRDGSLYQLGYMGDLKKLPYTIPQLVASAPCRSSDGILYSGKKSDDWFLIDPKTGQREKVMGFGSVESKPESIGWATSRSVYLGRTQYTVIMYDSSSKSKNVKPWNITFYDYSSHSMAPEISNEYEYVHLASSSTGLILTLDRKHGKFKWKRILSSPITAVFLLSSEGLLSVPFTTVSDDVLQTLLEEAKEGSINDVKLFNSLYIGEHPFGLYALPSLVDQNTATISSDPPVKLIEGPDKIENKKQNLVYLNDLLKSEKNIIVLGHYQLPKNNGDVKVLLTPSNTKLVDNKQLATIHNIGFSNRKNDFVVVDGSHTHSIGVQTDDESLLNDGTTNNKSGENVENKSTLSKDHIFDFIYYSKAWLTDKNSGGLHQALVVLTIVVCGMFWYTCSAVRELRQTSQNGSQTSNRSSGSNSSNHSDLIDVGNGDVQVGKINFNPNEILGKGCEGTFVFKGTFEQRNVAVKRVLPECFTFADREVALLRESDAHENVVRYFCTEQDRQFRYIAVELCAATLQDYTEGELSDKLQKQINIFDVLQQATSGLAHLHSLNIVHRDIKPQNVLISLPDANNCVRAMISDFGLCKKLNYGKVSFSRRSGVTGTEGWIAPEMLKGQRTTTSVDIFSLGCVFYYVLSRGSHAYGDTLKRQANILSNEYDLSKLISNNLSSENILAEQLIADMISYDAEARPSARAICNHPVFWNENRILAFLQDVSDRVEKQNFLNEPLRSLERNGRFVVKDDWNLHLDAAITDDLRKYRGYTGSSVRDLLRAFRNKKHHYHELSLEAQTVLGHVPHQFTRYWITKFPYLLSHVYHALSICASENLFLNYYDSNYQFPRPEYFCTFEAEDEAYLAEFIKANPKLDNSIKRGSPKGKPNRKGAYNFHNNKITSPNGTVDVFNRNSDSPTTNDNTNRNLFSNFRFRNRSSRQNYNRDRNVAWTLPDNNQTSTND